MIGGVVIVPDLGHSFRELHLAGRLTYNIPIIYSYVKNNIF